MIQDGPGPSPAIDPMIPVGELAARLPFTVRILENAGIDYHQTGARSLRDACVSADVSVDRILFLLAREIALPRDVVVDWLTAPLDRLVAHIVDGHHAFSRQLCGQVQMNLKDSVRAHPGRASLAKLAETFDAFSTALLTHFSHEEAMAFRYVSALGRRVVPHTPFSSIDGPTGILEFEHESVEDSLAGIRDLAERYMPPPGACAPLRAAIFDLASLERDLHEHLHLENNVLFPRARLLEERLFSAPKVLVPITGRTPPSAGGSRNVRVSRIAVCELEPSDVIATGCGYWGPRWTQGPRAGDVAALHAEGKRVIYWTMDDSAFIDTFLTAHPDGILSDHPGLVMERLQTQRLGLP